MAKNRNASKPVMLAITPEAEEKELRERLFRETNDELVKKQISNSENFDRSILTLSASGLGLSLAFVKDFAPLAQAFGRSLLVLSWGLFGAAVVATIASFMTSQAAIRFQMSAARKYYIERNDEFLAKTSIASRATDVLNFLAGAVFIAAIVCTIFFVSLNLPTQDMSAPAKPTPPQPAPQPTSIIQTTVTSIKAGQPVNQIQPVPTKKGK